MADRSSSECVYSFRSSHSIDHDLATRMSCASSHSDASISSSRCSPLRRATKCARARRAAFIHCGLCRLSTKEQTNALLYLQPVTAHLQLAPAVSVALG